MKRTMTLAALVVAVSLLAGGIALAQDIACGGGECRGTEQADAIGGTDGNDQIFGLGGGDTIVGDDERLGGSDLIRGGAGPDTIADRSFGDLDVVFGGKGDDVIDVRDGFNGAGGADVVDCGGGKDTVFLDPDDKAKNCERRNPKGEDPGPI